VRPDPDRLAHLPRDFAGQPEDLILIRDHGDERREVLRLWVSGTRLRPGEVPVWLGQVRIEAIDEIFGLVNRWRDVREPDAGWQALKKSLGDRVGIRSVAEGEVRLISRLPHRHPGAD